MVALTSENAGEIGTETGPGIVEIDMSQFGAISGLGFVVIAVVLLGMVGCPHYGVWQQGMVGEAELKRAEQNRKIAVQEAEAKRDAAKLLAESEVERARGVAEANKIIGDSLQGNDAYLRYLWIQGLQDGSSEVIYVPTEGQLPILEAGRLQERMLKPEVPQ